MLKEKWKLYPNIDAETQRDKNEVDYQGWFNICGFDVLMGK